jgi:hypothetical protein
MATLNKNNKKIKKDESLLFCVLQSFRVEKRVLISNFLFDTKSERRFLFI